METEIYQNLTELIYNKAGIRLGPHKEALMCARLHQRLHDLGLSSFRDYWDYINHSQGDQELVQLLNAISTNVTYFFREGEHFDFIQRQFKNWLDEGKKKFRFWSAACSSGEEPYSLAMTLKDAVPDMNGIDLKILGTDISTKVLRKAIQGYYSEESASSIPNTIRKHWCEPMGNVTPKGGIVVKKDVKHLVTFRRLNLSQSPFPMKGPLDLILCRNVMIYFDAPIIKKLIGEFYRLLKPGGYLITGRAESLTALMMRENFKTSGPSIYQKPFDEEQR